MAWLADYNRRKHMVTVLDGSVETDYQRRVKVYKSADSDSGEDVYLGAAIPQDDFDDVRFTKGDGSTLLYCWKDAGGLSSGVSVEYWVKMHKAGSSLLTGDSGADTVFDVADGTVFLADDWIIVLDDDTPNGELHQIDSISTNEITLKTALSQSYTTAQNAKCCHVGFLYYEYALATDPSDGAFTFIEFDDFERGNDQDAVGGDWTVNSGIVEISTEQKFGGTRGCKCEGGAGADSVFQQAETAGGGILVRFRSYREDAARYYVVHGDADGGVHWRALDDETLAYYDGLAWNDTGQASTPDVWELYEFYGFNYTADTYNVALDGSEFATAIDMNPIGNNWENIWRFIKSVQVLGRDVYFDDYFVRKWVATEPTWGAWGSEETAPTIHYGAATLSGVGALTGIGRGLFIGKFTLAGAGTLVANGVITAIGKAILSGVGSLAAIGTIITGEVIHYGSAVLSGVGSLTASGVGILKGSSTLSGIGSLSILKVIRIVQRIRRIIPGYTLGRVKPTSHNLGESLDEYTLGGRK